MSPSASIFKRLFHGASSEDLLWLGNFQKLRDKVRVFDVNTSSIIEAGHSIPWPVIWLLGRYSRKYIFANAKMPDSNWIHGNIQSFRNKMLWRWVFRKDHSQKPPIRVSASTPACSEIVAPEMKAWVSHVAGSMLNAVDRVRRSSRWMARPKSAMLPVTRLGLRILRDKKIVATPCDKEPGFAVRSEDQHRIVVGNIFAQDMYTEVHVCTVRELEVTGQVYKLSFKIQNLDGSDGIGKAIRKSLTRLRSTLVSNLVVYCKSHKPMNEVTHRNVHATPNFCLEGLSKWVGLMIKTKRLNSNVKHIMQTPLQSARVLRETLVPSGRATFIKADVKDFYLKGTAGEIVASLLAGTGPKTPQDFLIEDACYILLDNQFVRSRWTSETYKAVQGVGQGLPHSSEVADWSFFNIAESGLINNKERFGIICYLRYRDDILMVVDDDQLWRNVSTFIGILRKACPWWEIKLETVGKEVTYLNFIAYFDGSKIKTKPYIKPNRLASMPLCRTSAHASRVNLSWPAATLSNCYRFASTNPQKLDVYSQFCGMFSSHFLPIPRLPLPQQGVKQLLITIPSVPDRSAREITIWLPLAFHPLIENEIGRTLHRINSDGFWASVFSAAYGQLCKPTVRIAWTNVLKPLEHIIQR